MSNTYYGKRRLCYTNVDDFTDFQGIGRDRMYARYESVLSVVRATVDKDYWHFLAAPEYLSDTGTIDWHIDRWEDTPEKFTELSGVQRARYDAIKTTTIEQYNRAIASASGEELQILMGAMRYVSDEQLYCADGKVFLIAWGMTVNTRKHHVVGAAIHEYDAPRKHTITFLAGAHGALASPVDGTIVMAAGSVLSADALPQIVPHEGYKHTGWSPQAEGHTLKEDITFTAQYEALPPAEETPPAAPPAPAEEEPVDDYYRCHFVAGSYGTLQGPDVLSVAAHTPLTAEAIPSVVPRKGYDFVGWDIDPLCCAIDHDMVFTAQYATRPPWYKRWWLWLMTLLGRRSCLRRLLWLLIAILLILFLLWLLRGCHSCTRHREVNGVVASDTITTADGRRIDDNGRVRPIGKGGRLPGKGAVVAPVTGDDGSVPPILRQPGVPAIIANRLFLFLEDDTGDVDALARDFKQAYPDDRYSIIGYDREVRLLVIQVPESERETIRTTINSQLPNHRFIVFDEEIYEINGMPSSETADNGWHLQAIHLREGWAITRGAPAVTVAIVDDGIQATHPLFAGRITKAYNVYTQNNHLSRGEGHGTHTAALAAGSDDNYDQGASGVAPECMLMPVQVFDNGYCPLSALIAGVMYAVHKDAAVVNISIGPSFRGLDALPVSVQDEIARERFHNVEALWARVCTIAAEKRCILVFAAGNDDILASIPPENRNASSVVVAAVDSRRYPTTFTNYGTGADISAPGKGIYSAFPESTYKSFDGTSMSAPIVTGTIALMKSIYPALTVEQARNVLYRTGEDVYGWIPPMVRVDNALLATQAGDFSRGPERMVTPVPDDDASAGAAGITPIGGVAPGGTPGTGIVGTSPGSPGSPGTPGTPGTPDTPGTGGGAVTPPADSGDDTITDYDAIRRMIRAYEERIRELKKLLPGGN